MEEIQEQDRLNLQHNLDSGKTQAERNKLGQFATPTLLARDMLQYARTLLPEGEKVTFLDPGIGTGSFYSALLHTYSEQEIIRASGFEIDSYYANEAIKFWENDNLVIKNTDFTAVDPSEEDRVSLVIANPPYVRHHHLALDEKRRLQDLAYKRTGVKLSGLAGLYCYFLLLSDAWMKDNAIAGWLIPTEFMDVNYGEQLRKYLLNNVTLIRIHRFNADDVQFGDALVSSAIVWFRKSPPPKDHSVIFTYGGSLKEPAKTTVVQNKELAKMKKWNVQVLTDATYGHAKLANLFQVKRGIATGANEYFILSDEQVREYNIPSQFLRPILPSPRYLSETEIFADQAGMPILDSSRQYLFCCDEKEAVLKEQFPAVWSYIEKGIEQGIHERYLCAHRSPWYSQEKRKETFFLCTYMGRSDAGKPFRFILNHSKAIVTNVYLLLYPKPWLANLFKEEPKYIRLVWEKLNELTAKNLMQEGRLYGGGLHKMEPKELESVVVDHIVAILPQEPSSETPIALFD